MFNHRFEGRNWKIVDMKQNCIPVQRLLDHLIDISDAQNVHPIGAKNNSSGFSNDLRVLATSRPQVPGAVREKIS